MKTQENYTLTTAEMTLLDRAIILAVGATKDKQEASALIDLLILVRKHS